MSALAGLPAGVDDPVNAAILAISEDRISGYAEDPFGEIASRCGVDCGTVIERVREMLRAGTIRRVRQTLMATNLAPGALAAWEVPPENLDRAFEFMAQRDPFSGHVVIRSTERETAGSRYRLWTTLKVPQGFSLERHAGYLKESVGAKHFRLMPAKRLFTLGVGHIRRRELSPGSRAEVPADAIGTEIVALDPTEWRVLLALKREFTPEELRRNLWQARAEEAGLSLEQFHQVAHRLAARGVIGRFSTFLEHVKSTAGNAPVTRYNALFHWAVPSGRELAAGQEVGRHYIMTHAYWREAGPEFRNVNIMGVAHGLDRTLLLEHKAAIDAHLAEAGIEVSYTNVFWGGRSEIKPSEISPEEYVNFCRKNGLDPKAMRE